MSWTTGPTDLRALLSDGPTDKLRYRKRCIGQVDGNNTRFKSFEFKRATNFTESEEPQGVYVDGELQSVSEDFPEVGEFILQSAPSEGSVVEATYYVQWFSDDDLTLFLKQAGMWLGSPNVANLPDGLVPAALFYGAKLACEKLALKWAEYQSDTYMMQDAPKENQRTPAQEYAALAKQYLNQAEKAQENYYTRQGQNLQPLFASIPGNVRDVPPKG